ncbi:unnamed protein product [Cunninghamella echinulata]
MKNEQLQWEVVFQSIDHFDFAISDAAGLKLLFDAWSSCQTNKPFPINLFFTPWTNVRGQLSILYHMIYSNSDLLVMVQQALLPTTKIIRDTDIQSLYVSVRAECTRLANQPLNCLELVNTIIHLSDTIVSDDIRILTDRLSIQAPELLLLGMAQIQPIQNQLHRDTLLKLLNIFLIGHANSNLVIILLWKLSSGLLMDGFLALYKRDPSSISRILDVSQDAKILVHVLKVDVPHFSLDLASLAARRQYLNMEKWLIEMFANDKSNVFAASCIDFLEKKYLMEVAQQQNVSGISSLHLSVDVIRIFFRVLTEKVVQPFEKTKLAKLIQAFTKMYPQITENISTPPKTTQENNDMESTRVYAPDVEETVRRYFEGLYTKETSPSRFASLLKTCRNSSDQKQLDFFSCTIHTLLDEARFFDQYPDNELLVTGELLGLLVEHHLISYAQLRIALKYILDAVNNSSDSKMFNFGVQALLQFTDRYAEWPQYTMLLSKIDGLKAYPVISNSISSTLKQIGKREIDATAPNESSIVDHDHSVKKDDNKTPITSASTTATTATASQDLAPKVSSLLEKSASDATHEQPSTAIQERVSFLINNLSISNLDVKGPELRELLQSSTWPWFSHYLVIRRVSIEPNNHDLYVSLLNKLELSQLNDIVIEETLKSIHLLLKSDTIISSSADRKLLKNLGIWLGKMTIAKNKPIRHKDLSFKDLLLDAYSKDRLIVAIPLCCQVLRQSTTSKVFKPPNPWLMSLLKLLAELYWTEKLRLNLKFEIELLFDALELNLNEIEPTSILEKQTQPLQEQLNQQQQQQQQQQQPLHSLGSQPSLHPTAEGNFPPFSDQKQRQTIPNNQLPSDERPEVDISPLLNKLQFNPAISQFITQQPLAKVTIFRAISEAFADVVPPVILTSSNIAAMSTKELVLKDFATEPDELKLKRAAYSMIQPLVGNLAVATCKEPLYNAMVGTIREHLIQAGLPEPLSDDIATTIVSENLQLTCLFVQQLAQLRAINDIDNALSMAYTNRMIHREQQGGMYFDPLSRKSAPRPIPLPAVLKPNGPISPEQMFIYEAFNQPVNIPQQANVGQQMPQVSSFPSPHLPPLPPTDAVTNANALSVKLEQMLLEMDKLIRQTNLPSLLSLPPNHDLFLLVRQIPLMISQSSAPLPSVLNFVEKVVYMLYESSTTFGREIYVVFLQALFEISHEVTHETLAWFLYAEDQRKFHPDVISTLIQYDIILADEYDAHLAKMIQNKVENAIPFAIKLIELCLLSDKPFTFLEDHFLTITALRQQLQEDNSLTMISQLFDILNQTMSKTNVEGNNDTLVLNSRLLFAEWVRLCQHPMVTNNICQTMVKKIMSLTRDSSSLSSFTRMCTEVCVDYYSFNKSTKSANQRRAVCMIDGYAKLIAAMAKLNKEDGNEDYKFKIFSNSLSVAVLVLAQHHQQFGNEFNQKPFLRLFTSLFAEMYDLMDANMLLAYSETLLTIQPKDLPGFAFAWLQLISHRTYLPQLLVTDDNKGWDICHRLILGLLEFLGPLLEQEKLDVAIKTYYRGSLRVLVVLLHDFPEFLCHYYIALSEAIPFSCIQMRNLVLSAFPRTMHLPDPFTPNLQLDDLPESKMIPSLDDHYLDNITNSGAVSAIDQYFELKKKDNENDDVLESLVDKIMNEVGGAALKQHPKGLQNLGAIVLYIGSKASILLSQGESLSDNCAAIVLYKQLLSNMVSEGRYLLIGSFADHLRYPNSHTNFFSQLILYLFDKEQVEIKEQITRVLLERLIVNRPHPWGLLSLFIDLMKNDTFWKHDFIHCSPEIEQLFSNVSRSIKHAS